MANVNAQTRTNSSAFRSMLEKHMLTGPNFNEWFHALKLVVRTEKIHDVFETALPPHPVGVRDAPNSFGDVNELYQMYRKPPGVELQELIHLFHTCITKNKQQTVGASSSTPQVMTIQGGRLQKKPHGKAKGKGKAKGGQYSYPSKTKKPQPQKKERPTKEGQCHHCKEVRHWKRNCPIYLAELKNKKSGQMVASTSSSMFMIELYAFPKNIWVYDTGCGTHICNTKQGFRGARKLKRGSLYLYVFKNEVENQLGKTIKALRSDRGGEYISQEFKDYLKACGIVQQLTPPYTSQHNGVSERRNRCEAHVERHTAEKLEQRSVKCIFAGYPKETMGYYFYYSPENKVVVERYADFLEREFILQKESGRTVELDDEDTIPSENTSKHPIEAESLAAIIEEDVVPVRRSARTPKAPNRLWDKGEPASYKAALSDREFEKWLVAMNAKIQSMYDNKVWKLVDLPPGAKVVKSKWIYKKKTNMDGVVYIYKARLVAKGFTQTYGINYEETFSPVADIRAIRILIDIAAYYDYEIWKMDVKTAFFNGFLDEEIYTEQPEVFVDPDHPRK
nr:retrotransposon protein, putative, Ty1-copia subclass [Tanacetum cinerariifolium]